ncbi:MAG: hypothetical protein RSD67_04270 [Oscillospiraceae bacterium]
MYKNIKFFLGSNTRFGFVSRFSEIFNPEKNARLFILKGGAGCGKSTFMHRVAEICEQDGNTVEYISCASDPNSLDAIIVNQKHFAMVDGTSPHTIEPIYPGVYETLVPLGDAFDDEKLSQNHDEILLLNAKISACHQRATANIKAAAALLENNRISAKEFLNEAKINDFIHMFMNEIKNAPKGVSKIRLLSAVSVGEVKFFDETIHNICDKIYLIDDLFGALSYEVLTRIAKLAQEKGLACILCPCSIMGDDTLDHIIFPEIKVALTTSNSFHTIDKSNINCILNLQSYDEKSQEVSILNSQLIMAENLISTACMQVKNAKDLHDELEEFYKSAIDFKKVDKMQEAIVKQIDKMQKLL